MKTRDFRIVLFAALIATILFSGVCASEYYARPLLDEHISLITTANPTSYSAVSEQIAFSFLITNTSPSEDENTPAEGDNFIENIVMIDNLADNISCPASSLSPGRSMTCAGIYTISQEDIDRGEVISLASLSGMREILGGYNCCAPSGLDDSTYEAVYANADYTISLAKPKIQLEKAGSPNVFMGAGEIITYTYLITNTGIIALEGPILVQDNMVAVNCPASGLAPGEKTECTAFYTITEEDVARGVIINTALASVGGTNSSGAVFQIELSAPPTSPELSLGISTDPTTHAYVDELMIYIFDITNTGSIPLDSPFTINDPLLDQLVCSPPLTLSIGETFECRGYYRVIEYDIGKPLTNCASISGMYETVEITSEEVCVTTQYKEGAAPPAPNADPEPDTDPDSDDDD